MGDIFDARYLPLYATTVGGTVAVTYFLTKDWTAQHGKSDGWWLQIIGAPATGLGVVIGMLMIMNRNLDRSY